MRLRSGSVRKTMTIDEIRLHAIKLNVSLTESEEKELLSMPRANALAELEKKSVNQN